MSTWLLYTDGVREHLDAARRRQAQPELRDYLDTLLKSQERIRAATELDDWAQAEAMPSDVEIQRIRQLIRRIEDDLARLDEADQRQIQHAGEIVRATRQAVHLGMPAIRSPSADPQIRARMTGPSPDSLIATRRRDSAQRRQRVLATLDELVAVTQHTPTVSNICCAPLPAL